MKNFFSPLGLLLSCLLGTAFASSGAAAATRSWVADYSYSRLNVFGTNIAGAGNALQFDGTNDFVTIPVSAALNISTAITLEAWIYAVPSGSGIQNVVCKSSLAQNTGYIFPRTDDTWQNLIIYLHIGGAWRTYSVPYTSYQNSWHHAAATYDGSRIKIFIDGVKKLDQPQAGTITTNTNALTLGQQVGYGEYFNGKADEVRIWNVARTEAQVAAAYNSIMNPAATGLAAYYRLDEGSGTAAASSVAGANTGTLTNGPTWQAPSTAPLFGDPAITTFAPAAAPAGQVVTVNGSNFTRATGVTLSGTAVTYTVLSDTQISFTVPMGVASGTIAVTTPASTATSAAAFAVQPTITSLNPLRNVLGVPYTANVAVTFSDAMNAGTASAATLRVFSAQTARPGMSGYVGGGVYSGAGTSTITYNPNQDFKPGEVVWTTVTAAAQAMSSSTPVNKAAVYQFTAAAGGTGVGGFTGGTDVTVGTRPYHVATADVDGDGDVDLLAANQNSNSVSVRLNNGAGSFTAGSSEVAVAAQPLGVATGDLDGDGDLDLVSVCYTSALASVRLNNGSGAFTAGSSDVAITTGGSCIILADVDADGDLDFVTANYNNGAGNTLSVRLNNGAGTFSAGSDVSVGAGPLQVVAGDVDNDGDLDLVTANGGGNSVSVRLNNGAGGFSGTTTLTVGSGPISLALGDLDGDKDLDLLVANSGSNTLSEFVNTAGTFTLLANVAANADPEYVLPADVDADGDLDVLIANWQNGTITVRYNSGSGSFYGNRVIPVGAGPETIVAADLDNDGDLDFLTGNYGFSGPNSTVSVRFNSSGPPLPVELIIFSAQTEGSAVQLRWATASEKNNVGFTVERSSDARAFDEISTVAGAGSSTVHHEYAFRDEQLPAGSPVLYYRLRQLDLDGTTTFSPVRVVSVGKANALFQAYPTTVADGHLHYAFSGPRTTEAGQLEILTLTGRTVGQFPAEAAGAGTLSIVGLKSGSYWLRLTTAAGRYTSRFVVP